MFYISSMLLNLSILFKFTVFKIQIFFFNFNFQKYFVHFFFFLHQMTNFQQQMISQTFMWCKIIFPDWINIILFRNLFLSYTNINYSSFLCHLRNFNCQRMLFNWLDVGTSISQFNPFKHEIFIYIVFGECVTVKNSDNDLELYLKLIECNFRPSSYFLFA